MAHAGWYSRMRLVGVGLGLPLAAAGVWLMLGQNVMLPTPRLAGPRR